MPRRNSTSPPSSTALESARSPRQPINGQVQNALKEWHNLDANEPGMAALYLVRKQLKGSTKSLHAIINDVLQSGLQALEAIDSQASELLTLRWVDDQPVAHVARHFHASESNIFVRQNRAFSKLTATLQHLESQAWCEQERTLYARLEAPTTSGLVGLTMQIEQLTSVLCTPASPWIVAIEGLGGIGKTTLADATVRHAIHYHLFDEVGWVTARQQRLNVGGLIATAPKPALTAEILVEALAHQLLPKQFVQVQNSPEQLLAALNRHLKEVPHLIVIDNLETVLDLDVLLPTVQGLADPTKFLLTSREALFAIPNVYHFRVPELSKENALRLIRKEIEVSNLATLAACDDEELLAIFDVVGGNPLALRLVVGQTHIHALNEILDRLRSAKLEMKQGDPVENLYTYIYRHVWQSLTEAEREVLLIMPLVDPDGDDLATIAEMGEQPVDTIRWRLNRLVMLNLIDVHGEVNQRRYRIHGLTRTFLNDDILKW